MRLLLVDTETTGLLDDPEARVIELAYVVYDTDFGVIRSKSMLINSLKPDQQLTEEIVEITGIKTEILREFGYSPAETWPRFVNKLQSCHAVVCAYVEFDKGMIERELKLLKLESNQRVWIDFLDLPYHYLIKGRSTSHIAADHGIINHFAHRAFGDVLTMAAVLDQQSQWDWNQIKELACEPKVTLQALVHFNDREKARAQGFKWSGQLKMWLKTVPMSRADSFIKSCGFQVRQHEAKV